MKLLIYSHFFAPSVGGVETVVMDLAQGLARCKDREGRPEFEIKLVTQTPGGNYEDDAAGFPVIRQPSLGTLRALVRKADVLHIAGAALPPLVLGLLQRKPVVVEHHGFQTICPNGQLLIEPEAQPCPGYFMRDQVGHCLRCNGGAGRPGSWRLLLLTYVRRFLCKRIALNIAPTEWLAEQLKLGRTEVVPHGLLPVDAIQLAGNNGAVAPNLLFMGRLVNTKGLQLLIEAARQLRERGIPFGLTVIGDGPERRSAEAQVGEGALKDNIKFLGRVPKSELPEIFAKTTLVVVPSLGGEVFGMVVAENMRNGLPVIASDLGAFSEVLGGTGLLFKTGDALDLAERIAEALATPEQTKAMGLAGRQRVAECYSMNRTIEGHATLYRRLVQA